MVRYSGNQILHIQNEKQDSLWDIRDVFGKETAHTEEQMKRYVFITNLNYFKLLFSESH